LNRRVVESGLRSGVKLRGDRERDTDERRAGWEAPVGEAGARVAVFEPLGGFPEGGDEQLVGFPHLLADFRKARKRGAGDFFERLGRSKGF
jgi:hypothetical protein